MDEASVRRIVAERRAMAKIQKLCDDQDLPYPPELCSYLMDVHNYRMENEEHEPKPEY